MAFYVLFLKWCKSAQTAKDWTGSGRGRTPLSGCHLLIHVVGHLQDYVTDEALWTHVKDLACAAPFWWLGTASLSSKCMHYRYEGHPESVLRRRGPAGSYCIFLYTNTVGCIHLHPITIYTEGFRGWKGSLCIIPYTCIQHKNSLAVYIWKRLWPIKIYQWWCVNKFMMINFCSQLCRFFCIGSSVKGGGKDKQS